MPNRQAFRLRADLLAGAALLLLAAAGSARAEEVLYTLDTTCTIRGGAPVPCSVEAVDEGEATLYRHRIGTSLTTIRITDRPIRMSLWDNGSRIWVSLKQAGARFSTNTVCFNGLDFCVVNPNYLNSVAEENANTDDRDLVRVHFGDDGRIDASCYDDGCALIRP